MKYSLVVLLFILLFQFNASFVCHKQIVRTSFILRLSIHFGFIFLSFYSSFLCSFASFFSILRSKQIVYDHHLNLKRKMNKNWWTIHTNRTIDSKKTAQKELNVRSEWCDCHRFFMFWFWFYSFWFYFFIEQMEKKIRKWNDKQRERERREFYNSICFIFQIQCDFYFDFDFFSFISFLIPSNLWQMKWSCRLLLNGPFHRVFNQKISILKHFFFCFNFVEFILCSVLLSVNFILIRSERFFCWLQLPSVREKQLYIEFHVNVVQQVWNVQRSTFALH